MLDLLLAAAIATTDAGDALERAQDAFNAHHDRAALRWYRRAGFLGSGDGTYGEAYMVQYGRGTKPDPAYARELYARAADQGSVHAAYQLGYMNHQGVGGPVDLAVARTQYGRAADLGDAQGMFGLGSLAWLDTPDHAEGLRWFRSAVSRAKPAELPYIREAYFFLGEAAQDPHEAAALYRHGTDLGDAKSCVQLAYATMKGLGVPKDVDAAAALFYKAEELLPAYDQDRLVPYTPWLGQWALDHGSADLARHWLVLGADHDSPQAATLLGLALHRGRTLPRNDGEAEPFLVMGADAGIPRARHELIDLYAPDRQAKAYAWACISADAGDPWGWLAKWSLGQRLAPQQVREGAALAEAWYADHPLAIPSPRHKTP